MSPGTTSSGAAEHAPEGPVGADAGRAPALGGESPHAGDARDADARDGGPHGDRSRRARARRAARRAAADRRAFLADLSVALSAAADERAMLAVTARAVGERLGAARAGVDMVDVAMGTLVLGEPAYVAPGAVAMPAMRIPLAALGTPPSVFDGGRVLAVTDTATTIPPAAYAAFYAPRGIRAYLAAPRMRDGRVAAVLYADVAAPRAWSDNDVETVRAAAELLWGALDRAALRAELAAREAEFREMADNLPQLAWMADTDGSIVWYNRRWYDYTGTTFDEMRGGDGARCTTPTTSRASSAASAPPSRRARPGRTPSRCAPAAAAGAGSSRAPTRSAAPTAASRAGSAPTPTSPSSSPPRRSASSCSS
jgi:PAS domain-containing protein